MGVTLVPQAEVRNIMIPIFHDMMDWEQRKNGNFKQVTVDLQVTLSWGGRRGGNTTTTTDPPPPGPGGLS